MSRKHKKSNGIKKVKYDDFQFDDGEQSYLKSQSLQLRPFIARSEKQKQAYNAVKENTLTFIEGPAGTSKTFIMICVALQYLEKGLIKKIIITRPAIEVGQPLGHMPGGLKDKMDHFLHPIYDNLEVFLPKEKIKQLMEEEIIQIAAVGHMRGRNFHDSFIIVDEAQNLKREELYMVCTRIGTDSFMAVSFDEHQIDIKNKNDSMIHELWRFEGGKGIGFFEFGPEDVQRSRIVQEIVRLYQETENG